MIPLETYSPKDPTSTPWLNSRIKRLIRQTQRRYNAARHSNNEQDWRKFKILRKVVHNEMRKARQNYINKLLDIGDDVPGENTKPSITKRFWQYIKAGLKLNVKTLLESSFLNLTGRKSLIQNKRQIFLINNTTVSL